MTWLLFSVYALILLAIMIGDIKYHLIFDVLVFPAMLIVIGLALLTHRDMASVLVGGIAGITLTAILVLLTRQGVGWGDAKLSALVGFMVGAPNILYVFVGSFIVAFVIALAVMAIKKIKQGDLPFAPALGLATMATLILGR